MWHLGGIDYHFDATSTVFIPLSLFFLLVTIILMHRFIIPFSCTYIFSTISPAKYFKLVFIHRLQLFLLSAHGEDRLREEK